MLRVLSLIIVGVAIFFQGCSEVVFIEKVNSQKQLDVRKKGEFPEKDSNQLVDWTSYPSHSTSWGENVTGVKTTFYTENKEIALTFDACGGQYGSGYDEKLIDFLTKEQIPATLFINKRWITENEELFVELAENRLFQIENHGTEHLPLSVNGRTAWGIQGTNSPEEVFWEVVGNQEEVKRITGRYPTMFRSGTAYYDDVAVEIVEDIGLQVVNYSLLGDAGATFSSQKVKHALLQAKPGDIALLHMNQPQSGTAQGVIEAIPILEEAGFSFVTLEGYELR
ncbi:polysaccharide deacetylase family protein [Bacillus alkalicellulosilyticus]|uniref:polysaccharide deacetylase family protein n=1 Tax=Alkalihalobacterium alkalicellulosilyticum TaxID=1912214 RepID=UPI0009975569|nr:polysaccharide deacetylase family protein [Bacillus alkalicellulosilyticus]